MQNGRCLSILLFVLMLFFSSVVAESPCKSQSRWHAELYDENTQETTVYTPEEFFTSDGAMIDGYVGQPNLIPGYFFKDTTCYMDDFEIEYIIRHVTGWKYIYAGMSITAEPNFELDSLRSKTKPTEMYLFAETKSADSLRADYTVMEMGFHYHNDTLEHIRNGIVYDKQVVPICKIKSLFVYWAGGGGGVESIRLIDHTNNTEYFEDFSDCENIQLFKECEPDPVVELTADYQLPSCEDSSLYLFAHSNVLEDFHWIGPDGLLLSEERNPVVKDGWKAQSGTYIVWGKLHRCANPVYYKVQIDIPEKEVVRDSVSLILCWPDSLRLKSGYVTESGVYVDSLFSAGGCDSVVVYDVDVRKPTFEDIYLTTCNPDSVLFNGKCYSESGTFSDTLKFVDLECDSIVYSLSVEIRQPAFGERYDTVCYGESIDGHEGSGVYIDTLLAVNGCDSVDVLHLEVLPKDERDNGIFRICEGDSVEVNGRSYFKAGTYLDTVRTLGVCDSFLTTKVEVDPTFVLSEPPEVKTCRSVTLQLEVDSVPGASYLWSPSICLSDTLVRNPFVTATEDVTYKVLVERGLCRDSVELNLLVSEGPRIKDVFFDAEYQTVTILAEGGIPDCLYAWQSSGWQANPTFDTNISVGRMQAKVKDDYGCEDEYSYLLLIPIFPEDHLSPNGDGIKDRWEIRNLEYYQHFVVKIFDRFGKQLVVYRDYYPGWDGYYQGHPMPSTDYWYVISIDELDYEKSGHFTLLRR